VSDEVVQSFAACVRELRRRLGLTQGELGKRLGVSQTAVSDWERGRYMGAYKWAVVRLAELAEGASLGPPPPEGCRDGRGHPGCGGPLLAGPPRASSWAREGSGQRPRWDRGEERP
jgi:hypothetical protein